MLRGYDPVLDRELATDLARWETDGGAVDDKGIGAAMAWFEEHTSEITLRVSAPSLTELFAKAGEALAGLMLGETAPQPETAHERLVLEARDRAALLVAWLDELIGRAELAKVVFTRFDVRLAGGHELTADIYGVSPTSFRNPVKAATYHRLAVQEVAPRGYAATVVLDV